MNLGITSSTLCDSWYKFHEETVVVVDDIRWSAGMETAWQTLCAHQAVTLSLDVFDFGLLFFRKKQPKQHFTIKY